MRRRNRHPRFFTQKLTLKAWPACGQKARGAEDAQGPAHHDDVTRHHAERIEDVVQDDEEEEGDTDEAGGAGPAKLRRRRAGARLTGEAEAAGRAVGDRRAALVHREFSRNATGHQR